MMLLHRMEWWATLVADATVMQQISQQAIASRLKGRNKWTTVRLSLFIKLILRGTDAWHPGRH